MSEDRLNQLQQLLNQDPKNSFLRYALAMELCNHGRTQEALEQFQLLVREDPGYLPTYYQLGKLLVQMGQFEEARSIYQAGIQIARKVCDLHTEQELEAALADLTA